MDDESYENMPDEKKKEIDIKLLAGKKLRLKRYIISKLSQFIGFNCFFFKFYREAEEKAAENERREREAAELAKLEEEKFV